MEYQLRVGTDELKMVTSRINKTTDEIVGVIKNLESINNNIQIKNIKLIVIVYKSFGGSDVSLFITVTLNPGFTPSNLRKRNID